jgi:hypothetical protein
MMQSCLNGASGWLVNGSHLPLMGVQM